MFVLVNNPSLTLFHVVSLTVPTKTAPVGTNPFEEDEDEEEEEEEEEMAEEMAEEQQTTVNHSSVNKEEIKTLVNRRKHSAHLQPRLFSFCLCSLERRSCRVLAATFFVTVTSLQSSLYPLCSSQVAGCCAALHGL